MRIEGAIYPTGGGAGFGRKAWCQLVATRPEFRRDPPRQSRNPFTGGAMTVQPPADAAAVMVGDRTVGEVSWSMSDEPLVNVSVEPSVVPLVREWAALLGGEFRPDSPVSAAEPGTAADPTPKTGPGG